MNKAQFRLVKSARWLFTEMPLFFLFLVHSTVAENSRGESADGSTEVGIFASPTFDSQVKKIGFEHGIVISLINFFSIQFF